MQVRKSLYNFASDFIGQIITIALGIVIPRLFIVSLGSEANGLLSSISQVFVYLGLLEAGVGLATTQALYKPIASDDKKEINAILSATNRYFKKTGLIYFICLIVFSILYPLIVESTINKFVVFGVIIFQGLGSVLSYFFQAKYRLLMQAEGKGYILTNLTTIIHIFVSLTKIALLLLGFNVLAIQIMYFVYSVIQLLFITGYIKKNYSWINLRETPNFKAISQKSSVLIIQISGMIFNNTDVLILTFFCDLKVVSVYVVYNLIFSMIQTFMSTISSSVSFQLGQIYATDRNKFTKIFDIYECYYGAINFAVCTTAYIFIIPFIKLYTAGIDDINYVNYLLPVLFVLINLLSNGKLPANQAVNVAGKFKETKWRGVIESLINIVFSLAFVKMIGLPGVLIGTIIALLYRVNDYIIFANKNVLNRRPIKTYLKWFLDLLIMIFVIVISKFISFNNESYFMLILNSGIVFLILMFVFCCLNSIIDFNSFKLVAGFIKNKLKNKG